MLGKACLNQLGLAQEAEFVGEVQWYVMISTYYSTMSISSANYIKCFDLEPWVSTEER